MINRVNIFLDLDNTIISSVPLEEIEWTPEIEDKISHFKFYNMEDYYIVFERPHLQSFLDFLFDNFNVSVWTAATKDYALFIIEKIILRRPGRKLDMILFSYHCDISEGLKKGIKNLSTLSREFHMGKFDMSNTYIIDDLPEIKEIQPENCISVKPFEFEDKGSENDDELLRIEEVLQDLL